MLLSLQKKSNKRNKQTNKQSNKPTTRKHTKTATTYSPCLHYRWRWYQAIALNDQQVGPTSIALLSP